MTQMAANQKNLNEAVRFLKAQGFADENREITELDVSTHTDYYENEKGETKVEKMALMHQDQSEFQLKN